MPAMYTITNEVSDRKRHRKDARVCEEALHFHTFGPAV